MTEKNINPKMAGLLMVLIGIGMLLWFGNAYRTASKSESWPQTEGVITLSRIARTTASSSAKLQYIPEVEYQYNVDGMSYTSDTLAIGRFDMRYDRENKARYQITRYPRGKQVMVFYDPFDPGQATLERGINGWIFLGLGIGVALITAGWFMRKEHNPLKQSKIGLKR